MNEVYKEYFSPPYPSRATVVVKELMGPTMRVEIVAHANLGAAGRDEPGPGTARK